MSQLYVYRVKAHREEDWQVLVLAHDWAEARMRAPHALRECISCEDFAPTCMYIRRVRRVKVPEDAYSAFYHPVILSCTGARWTCPAWDDDWCRASCTEREMTE